MNWVGTVWLKIIQYCKAVQRLGAEQILLPASMAVDVACAKATLSAPRPRLLGRERHRMAPEVETQVAALRASGRLEIVARRIVRANREKRGSMSRLRGEAAAKLRCVSSRG
jgi:hypothetical protein